MKSLFDKPKQYSTNKTYEGEISTEALNRETTTGKRVWWWAIKTKKELIDMQAWENSCDGDFSRLRLGATIIATGYWKQVTESDASFKTFLGESGNQIFILKAFYFEDQTKPLKSMKDHILKEYGSIAKWREDTKAWIKSSEALTKEKACISDGFIVYRKLEDCIGVGKQWIPKIDFCMDTLGTKFVEDEIRKLTNGDLNFVFNEKGRKAYKELRERLTLMAMEKLQPRAKTKSIAQLVDDANL